MQVGFDNDKYIRLQSQKINERVQEFGGKLYLEFGGKLFDDYHASRVLPGFLPDSKVGMLATLADQVEVVIAISAKDIAKNRRRSDIGITYDEDVLRLFDLLKSRGLYVSSVVITQYDENNPSAVNYKHKLESLGIKVYRHYTIEGYPSNVDFIVSPSGFGVNDYVATTRKIVVVTAPGPASGKMAVCLSQMYHDSLHGISSGYAKFETFPIWNLPLNHPVNIAYEAATADLNDINMIDPWHMQAYGVSTINYNRDVEVFPVLNAIFTKVLGKSPYQSPTDMGVNMAGYCICDNQTCEQACKQEIVRRYLRACVSQRQGLTKAPIVDKLRIIMSKLNLSEQDRQVTVEARNHAEKKGCVCASIQLPNGVVVCGKGSALLSAPSATLLNALKAIANLPDMSLIAPSALQPIQKVKTTILNKRSSVLNCNEALIALSVSASLNPMAEKALQQLPQLRGCQAHVTNIPLAEDEAIFRQLGIELTADPIFSSDNVFFK